MLRLELFLCTPFSNTTLDRFFSHLKVLKTQLRSNVLAKSVNSIIRTRMNRLSLEEFNQDYASKCAAFWYGSKACHLNLNEKNVSSENPTKEKRVQFDINELKSKSSSCYSKEEC